MTDRTPVAEAASLASAAHLRGRMLVVIGLLLTLMLTSLDATIVGTALPTIVGELHGFALYSWVVTAYLLASTTVVPIVGKLSDQFGRKGFALAGIALFLLGSALAGAAQTMTQLIICRGLQGLGAGCLQTVTFTLVADLFSPAERGRWQGVFVSVASLALITGPAIGGLITDHTTWRWVFYVNLPVGIVALLILALWLPATISVRSSADRGWAAVRRIDFAGALLAASATASLLLALTWGGSAYPWGSAQVIGLLIAAAALYLAFLLTERFVREPLLPLDLFRNQVYAACALLAMAGGAVIYAMIFYLPLFMQDVLSQTATDSGARLAPLFIPVAIGALVGGQLITKMGRYHLLAVIGAAILLGGLLPLARIGASTTLGAVTLAMVVVGLGMGILQPIYTVAGQNAIPPWRLGVGTGAINYLRAIGSLVGTAVLGALVTHAASGGRSGPLSLAARQALAMNIGHAFEVVFGVAVVMLIITLFLKDVRLRRRGESAPSDAATEAIASPQPGGAAARG